jgi:hypothetical protein
MRILGSHCWESVTTFACRLVSTAAWVVELETDTFTPIMCGGLALSSPQ